MKSLQTIKPRPFAQTSSSLAAHSKLIAGVILLLAFFLSFPSAATEPLIEIDQSPASTQNSLNRAARSFSFFPSQSADKLLTPEQAFVFSAYMKDHKTLALNWQIAEGYYLYRDKTTLSLAPNQGIRLAPINYPKGVKKHDETFGEMVVYYAELNLLQTLAYSASAPSNISLSVNFQGCAEIGVCYPPMKQSLTLDIPQANLAKLADNPTQAPQLSLPEQNRIAQSLISDSALWVSLSFLGFGLLLAFTPCVFPMIPILSGIIVGHGKDLTTRKAFFLSLSYVLAAALTYAVFGVLAGLFGSNLQASFQNPWVISAFSVVFIALALSMFGLYQIQVPSFLQNKLSPSGAQKNQASLANSAIMGALSALIVGPCVAAPLAGALIYIGQTGDALLGAFALFSLGLGMGLPLLIIGTSAGKLLPKAGSWMEPIKYVFGVLLIAVAISLMERIISPSLSLFLWACLLIICSFFLSNKQAKSTSVTGWQTLSKGVGSICLIYGIVLILGAASGASNPFQPLANLTATGSAQQKHSLEFKIVTNLDELNSQLSQAASNQQLVMLDFYADWCVSCKEMERDTFTDPTVVNRLRNTVLLQVDVTENNAIDRAILKQYNLIGPPAILFFAPDIGELSNKRIIGYMGPSAFSQHLKALLHV